MKARPSEMLVLFKVENTLIVSNIDGLDSCCQMSSALKETEDILLIKYTFATGEGTEVEVSEEIGAVVLDLDRQEYNANHRETRRHCSLEAYNLDDALIPSDENVEEDFLRKEQYARLYAALGKLDPRQRYLVEQVYLRGRKITDIARDEGRHHSSIQETLNRALKNLKKFL